jgi:hypothetical protein
MKKRTKSPNKIESTPLMIKFIRRVGVVYLKTEFSQSCLGAKSSKTDNGY